MTSPADRETSEDTSPRDQDIVTYMEDGVSIRLHPAEIRKLRVARYRAYLGPFFCPPMVDPSRRQTIRQLFAAHSMFYSLYVPSVQDRGALMRQVVMEYLLSFGEKRVWAWKTTQALVEGHFEKEVSMRTLDDYELLVIIHTGREIQHTYNLDLTLQIIEYRRLAGKHTLFICPSESTVSHGLFAMNPFKDDLALSREAAFALSGGAPPVGTPPLPGPAPAPDLRQELEAPPPTPVEYQRTEEPPVRAPHQSSPDPDLN